MGCNYASLPNSSFSDAFLVAWNQRGEIIYHGNNHMLQIRTGHLWGEWLVSPGPNILPPSSGPLGGPCILPMIPCFSYTCLSRCLLTFKWITNDWEMDIFKRKPHVTCFRVRTCTSLELHQPIKKMCKYLFKTRIWVKPFRKWRTAEDIVLDTWGAVGEDWGRERQGSLHQAAHLSRNRKISFLHTALYSSLPGHVNRSWQSREIHY